MEKKNNLESCSPLCEKKSLSRLFDLIRNWWRSGQMISLNLETTAVGCVVDCVQFTIVAGVRVGTLNNLLGMS